MNKYSFTIKEKNGKPKGKMYDDCDINLEKNNFKLIKLFKKNIFDNIRFLAISFINIIKMNNNSLVLVQYPRKILKYIVIVNKLLLKIKKIRVVVFIHDIESLRWDSSNNVAIRSELKFLKKVDYVICHNEMMKEWLIKNGIQSNNLLTLDIFDFLCDRFYNKDITKTFNVCIATNLSPRKSGYIYLLNQINNISFSIYGNHLDLNKFPASKSISYKGFFIDEDLIGKIDDSFGLVWDGDALDFCSGDIGNYLRYNNPFKVSMYIAAEIPIIVWEESAIAKFIITNNVGFTIKSLKDIQTKIESLSIEDYIVMRKNVIELKKKLMVGFYFSKVIKSLEKIALE